MHLLSAISCECDLDLCYFNVDQAFVQSDLEDVFLRLPKGSGDLSGKVIRLNKSLYGLKQASRTWHAHLTTCLKRLGFEQYMTDVCVFRLVEDGRVAITAVVYVDDIFAVGQKERCDRLCVDLNRTIPVKNLADLKWYGGCRYSRNRKRGTLTIFQQSFAEELAKKFHVTSVQSVPLEVGVELEEFDKDEETESWPFRELVGGLMRLAISTRPDISNAVRSVARYSSAPKAIYWKSALGILAYINGTCGFGIRYQRRTTVGISLEVFADADYASKATDRRFVSGGAIMCAGACIYWFSRTQKCAILSTFEAEYVALGDAVNELSFLRQVWRFMIPGKGMPCFPVFEDNQGALQLSKNPVSNSNPKHRELIRQGDIIVNHVPSEYQHAGILTKGLAFDLFAIHRRFLMNLSG